MAKRDLRTSVIPLTRNPRMVVRLRLLAEEAGVNLNTLATIAGMHQATIWAIANGTRYAQPDALVKICDTLSDLEYYHRQGHRITICDIYQVIPPA